MYDIEFSKIAEKQFYKLEKNIQLRIISILKRIKIRPFNHVIKLVGSPYFRLRVGDYRIMLDIDTKNQLITILKVAHRKNIYDR